MNKTTVRAMVARYNRAKNLCVKMQFCMETEPELLSGNQLSFLRESAHELAQCIHEFNAYRNVIFTHGNAKGDEE